MGLTLVTCACDTGHMACFMSFGCLNMPSFLFPRWEKQDTEGKNTTQITVSQGIFQSCRIENVQNVKAFKDISGWMQGFGKLLGNFIACVTCCEDECNQPQGLEKSPRSMTSVRVSPLCRKHRAITQPTVSYDLSQTARTKGERKQSEYTEGLSLRAAGRKESEKS